jgi:lipopolysaccharide/colanic/teichoic acid biosynthesis glycosyltransferase
VSYIDGDGSRSARAPRRPGPPRAALRPVLKRAIDVAAAALLLLLVAPTFVLVLLLVRADGGPAFVGHPRIGRAGREFRCLKFRVPGGHAHGAPGEERPNRIGRALRWTALEELPQLLNVLRGDMSLVGPRPATREELGRSYALFGGEAAYLSVRPGLTGPCRIRGRDDLGAGERVALDAVYAQRISLRADLAILAATLRMVLRRPEAR